MIRERTLSLIMVLLLFPGFTTSGDWTMVSRDPSHTGSIEVGAEPPLTRAWKQVREGGDGFTAWPIVTSGLVLAKSGSGLIAVEAKSGTRSWFKEFEVGHSIGTPAADRGRVYVPLHSGILAAVDLRDGSEIWRFKAERELDASPAVSAGRIFVNSARAKTTYCINVSDGSSCWTQKFELDPDTVPAESQGVVVILAGSLDKPKVEVYALKTDDGSVLWSKPQSRGYGSASVLDDKVILGGGDFYAHALDLKTGKSIWKSPVKGKFGPRNLPALAFGDVFLADRIGNIYRLDGDTGKQKWTYEVPDEGTFEQSFPIIAGKTLFIGSGSGWLYALHTDTGRLLWKEQVGGFVLSGAADSERFYFGVKFRNEGLYAYEHDPDGRLEPPPNEPTQQIIAGVLLFAILVGGVWLYGRRRRSAEQGP